MSYQDMALIYDYLMRDVDYVKWSSFLREQIYRHKAPGNSLLDLGCGTGSISLLLAQKGFQVVCVDISSDMLSQAEQKFRESNLQLPIYQQDIRELYLKKPVDTVISTFDTMNYIIEPNELEKVFQNVANVLNPEGLFIFDLNTTYKLAHVLGNNTFTYNTENLVYIWENYYDMDAKLCEMDLTFFLLEEFSGKYSRFNEQHIQRAYAEGEINSLLLRSGFTLLGTYGELSFQTPKAQEEKIFFVARKKANKS